MRGDVISCRFWQEITSPEPIAYLGQHSVSDNVLLIDLGRQLRDTFVENNGCQAQSPEDPAPGSGQHIKTNHSGCTAICPITLFDNTTTTLTYPQEMGDYGTDYWLALTCPQTRRDVILKSHPDFNEWFFTGTRTRLRQPGGFRTQSGVYDDVRGINWGCLTERDPVGEFSAFLIDAFPDEAAFPSCMHSVSVPVNYLTTAALLTVPSVSYEGDEDTTSEPTRSTIGDVPISTGRTEFPTTTAQPGNPPEAPAPSTKAPTVLPPASETTVQAPDPEETSEPEQPPVAPAPPSTQAGTDLPPTSEAPVQVPGPGETSQPAQIIPVGSTSVSVVPTAIQTVISGSSTSIPAVVVGSSTLTAGQTAVVDNTPIVVPTANNPAPQPSTQGPENDQPPSQPESQPAAIIVGGSSTITLPTAAPPAAAAATPEPPTLTLADGQTIPPSGSAYIISGQTLAPDSPALTLGGSDADSSSPATIIALTTNAAGSPIVLIGASGTVPYTAAPPPTKPALLLAPALPTLTLANGQTLRPSGSAYVVAGTTLTPGAPPLTLDGGAVALTTDAAGSRVVVVVVDVDGTSTVAYAAPPPTPSSAAPPLVVAGQTLTAGGTVTVGEGEKTTLVMTTDGAGRTVVVQQGEEGAGTAASASATEEGGLGGLVDSGLGGSGRTTSSTAGSSGLVGSSGSALPSSGSAVARRVVGGELFAVVVMLSLLVGGV
ncbi:hypothetical protein GTA08_BOTSDO13800 [Botryosphaeria dothidea]|uniref:Uncharacterized protein n=1 Tax=Botryosphaeria dothidea TaxID=55169 RepID=A0A8H4J2J4_9PEZI|nr:hypothetical protein GTA08_BOTSDO13800 [Botryosphaeria dothidea]